MMALARKAMPYVAVLAIVLGGLWLAYSKGGDHADLAWQSKWDKHMQDDAKATAQAQAEQRAIEAMRQQSINKVTQDAQQAIDRAQSDAADAAATAVSLRDAIDQTVSRLADSQARISACTTDASKAATTHARVLADVLKRADSRAGHLAGVADQAIERGLSCERAYDAVSAP